MNKNLIMRWIKKFIIIFGTLADNLHCILFVAIIAKVLQNTTDFKQTRLILKYDFSKPLVSQLTLGYYRLRFMNKLPIISHFKNIFNFIGKAVSIASTCNLSAHLDVMKKFVATVSTNIETLVPFIWPFK